MTRKNKELDIQVFLEKVKKMEKGEKFDLSSGEDLSIAIMNLISMEEHFFFTYAKTKDERYLKLLDEIREMRKILLKRIIKDYEGEVWCISKHLLAASMRLMEVGTKFLTKKDKKQAEEMFEKSYQLYNLFWALNMGAVKPATLTNQLDAKKIVFLSENKNVEVSGQVSIFERLGQLVQKAVDCCKE